MRDCTFSCGNGMRDADVLCICNVSVELLELNSPTFLSAT